MCTGAYDVRFSHSISDAVRESNTPRGTASFLFSHTLIPIDERKRFADREAWPRQQKHAMAEGRATGGGHPWRRGAAMLNALDPELLSPDARLAEVGALLSTGLVRCRLRAAGRPEKDLAIQAAPSDSYLETSSGGRET